MVWMGVKELAPKVVHAQLVPEYSKINLGAFIWTCENNLYIPYLYFFFLTIMFYVPQIETNLHIFSLLYIDIKYIHLFPRSIRKMKNLRKTVCYFTFSVILVHIYVVSKLHLLAAATKWLRFCVCVCG